MFPTFRRLIIVAACLLYAGACAALAAHNGEAAWALWVAAVSHLIFGMEALLQIFFSNEIQTVIDRIRMDLETKLADEGHARAELEERVARLSSELANLHRGQDQPSTTTAEPSSTLSEGLSVLMSPEKDFR